MNELLCRLLDLLKGSFNTTNSYGSQLNSPGLIPQNPVTVPSVANPDAKGATSIQLLQTNKKRKQWIVQNIGTTALAIKLGGPPNVNSKDITLVLPASTSALDGTGGLVIDDLWKGSVFATGTVGQGTILITEMI